MINVVCQDTLSRKPGRLIDINQLLMPKNTRNQRAVAAIVKYDPVSAAVLGFIQGLVGELNKTLCAPVQCWLDEHGAYADRKMRSDFGAGMRDLERANRGDYLFRQCRDVIGCAPVTKQRKLLAPNACRDIQRPRLQLREGSGHLSQATIAGLVAVAVIVVLEMINIDK